MRNCVQERSLRRIAHSVFGVKAKQCTRACVMTRVLLAEDDC